MPKRPFAPRRIAASRWLWRAATIGWCGVIFLGSSLQGSQVPGRFGPLGHFGEYAILAVLAIAGTRPGPTLRRALIAVAFAAVYALTDEFHQSFVPTRMPDPIDWLVDVAGALTGVGAYLLVARRASRARRTQ